MERDHSLKYYQQPAFVGGLCALAAYGIWGLIPAYFKLLKTVSALEVLAHRIVWSAVFLSVLTTLMRRWDPLLKAWRNPRLLALLALTMTLIGFNWFIFVWGILNNRVVETSLGYYINPLVNTLLGAVFLGERLNRWQGLAVFFAALGVSNEVIQLGHFPWISLVLAISFGLYGLLRKKAPIDPLSGLLTETLWALPLALGYLFWLYRQGQIAWGQHGLPLDSLLLGTGVVTAFPLLLFAMAAKRMQLTTLGLFQYLSPTLALMEAIFWFKEPFPTSRMITFALIWSGLIIYSWGSLASAKRG